MEHSNIIIGILVLLILYFTYINISKHLNLTKISAGYNQWNVINTYENKQEAAELMERVNSTMIKFLRFLKKKYHIDETSDIILQEGSKHKVTTSDIYNMIDNLLDNYNYEKFYENDPAKSNETSYTMNKGDAMYICLRDKQNPNKLVNFDTLLFVLMHESAHIANYNDFGHTVRFWTIFKLLLNNAVEAGIYTPVNYQKYPTNYCGLLINYQPLFDDNLPNL